MDIRRLATYLVLAILPLSCPSFGDNINPNIEDGSIDIEFYAVTSSSISISWEEWAKSLNKNTSTARFEVIIAYSNGNNISSYLKSVNCTSHHFEELKADTEYSFSVIVTLKTPFYVDSGVQRLHIMTHASERTLCSDPPTPSLSLTSLLPTKANLHYTISDWNCSNSVTVLQTQVKSEIWETVLQELKKSSFSIQVLPCTVNKFRIQHLDPDGNGLLTNTSSIIVKTPNKRGGPCRTEAHWKQITGACVGAGVVFVIITFYSFAYCHWRLSGGHIPPNDGTDPHHLVSNEKNAANNNQDEGHDAKECEGAIVNQSYVEDQV